MGSNQVINSCFVCNTEIKYPLNTMTYVLARLLLLINIRKQRVWVLMSDLFSKEWMVRFQQAWNNDAELSGNLAQIKFNSTIAYGFKSEQTPRGVIQVTKGKVTLAEDYDAVLFTGKLDWDLRAEPEDWREWFQNPPGMISVGMAYTSRKLVFKQGDYAAMIKDPRIAGPFVKSFLVMANVE